MIINMDIHPSSVQGRDIQHHTLTVFVDYEGCLPGGGFKIPFGVLSLAAPGTLSLSLSLSLSFSSLSPFLFLLYILSPPCPSPSLYPSPSVVFLTFCLHVSLSFSHHLLRLYLQHSLRHGSNNIASRDI